MLQNTTRTKILSIILAIFLCTFQCFTDVSIVSASSNESTEQDSQTESTSSTNNSVVPTNTPNEASVDPTANIRLMFTTDLHGALTTTNLETGSTLPTGTLARCATLIQQARSEKQPNNSFLFDLGDALYDYSTDYLFEHDSNTVQPIYNAMKSLKYDAITLGNHEFDYNLSYIQNQIANSGLQDICVVSNVKYKTTQKNVWKENLMLNRTVTLSDGSTTDIKIGVIGETQPVLSSKRTKYSNTLSTQKIVDSTREQAVSLKEAGADLIVVLAHCGISQENTSSFYSNDGYLLTKIPEVDVVLCGHSHQYFPSDRAENAKYYELPGIEKETGLVNGKNMIMVADKGAAIGIADLTITKKADSSIQIADRTSTIRQATKDIAVDNNINNNFMGTCKNIFISAYNNILGEISDSSSYNNYFAALEDNSIIQIINDAKMNRALNIINTLKKDYKNYPVIAASNYIKSGSEDDKEFLSFSDYLFESYLSSMQIYRTGIYLYEISGKQLKEWMEWSSSAYKTTSESASFSSSDIQNNKTTCSQTLLQDCWNSNFSNFYVFDGVEYVVDTTVNPRYDISGNKISDNTRIRNLTRNGVPVSDTDKFIIATNKLEKNKNNLITEISKRKVYEAPSIRWRTVIKEYLETISLNSTLGNIADDNWHVITAKNSSQVVKSGLDSKKFSENKEWISSISGIDSDFIYYNIDMSKQNTTDKKGPNIIATPLSDKLSHDAVTVSVQTHDRSGVASVQYAKGKYTIKSDIWNDATKISTSFSCKETGIYTILATDTLGNRTVYYVRIQNINKDTIAAPVVDMITNRNTKIKGTAPAKSTVYIKTSNRATYKTKANASGIFSRKIALQKADTNIYIYAVDSTGRTSPRVVTTVVRSGPNRPKLKYINSNSAIVTGSINDTFAYPFLYVEDKNTVYVPKVDGKELYKASTAFDSSVRIVKVPCNISNNGSFTIKLPCIIPYNTSVVLYSLDNSSRKSCNVRDVVNKKRPSPSLKTSYISNNTTTVNVSCRERCKMIIKIDSKDYMNNSVKYDPSIHSYLYKINIPKTNTYKKIKIYAKNSAGNSGEILAPRKEIVPNTPTISSINLKKKTIRGKVHFIDSNFKKSTLDKSKTKVYVKANGKKYRAKISTNGNFVLKITKLNSRQHIAIWATNVNGTSPIGRKSVI